MAKTPRNPRLPRYSVGLIERSDQHYLIVLPEQPESANRLWGFPQGEVKSDESPEGAMRRIASERFGLAIDVLVGQPPYAAMREETTVEIRCLECVVTGGEASTVDGEIRWVSKLHLREYEFDAISKPMVDWLLEE